MPKIKITCIIHSLSIGGMERVMSILLNDFAQRENLQVDLVLIGRSREIVYPIAESIKIHRPNFHFDSKKRFWHTLKTLLFIRRTLQKIDPDTVLSFGELWNNLVLISGYGLPYPIFVTDRCKPDKSHGKLHDFLREKLYPNAAGLIAQTEYAADFARKQAWNKNICTIGNPIKQINDNIPMETRENIVLSIGRLIRTKHFDDLITMFVALKQPDWKLIIVGGNALKQDGLSRLQRLIKELKAENKVQLTGEIKNVEDYYRKASIFAFTSSSEGFPNVVGEALSYGLPVVAYDCVAGPADMISHKENGYLIKVHDHTEFKKKLLLLMNHPSLRTTLSKKTELKIREFSETEIAQKFFEFITSLSKN